jgi:hypothetical protein
MSLKLIFFLTILKSNTLYASDLQLRSEINEYKSQITASYELTDLKTDEGNIAGAGLRVTFNHWLTPSLSLDFGASVAINNQSSVQSNSFTGFNFFTYYNVFGKPYGSEKKIQISDHSLLTERQKQRHSLFVGAGVSQYFLNGNRGVYSASGLGVGAIYQFQIWNTLLRLSSRWNQLEASQIKIDGLSYDLGICFSL